MIQSIMMLNLKKIPLLTVLVFVFSTPWIRSTQAAWTLLPESHQQQYLTNAIFIDQQNIIAYCGHSKFWATVAANFPITGNEDSPLRPQLVFHFSGSSSMHLNDGGGVFTESLDTRIAFYFTSEIPLWDLRGYIGYKHKSGHTVDGTDAPELGPLNLGDNTLRFRLIRDFGTLVRTGFDFYLYTHAIPAGPLPHMEYFAEYFPLGANESAREYSPFISGSLAQRYNFTGHFAVNLSAGVMLGTHFTPKHTQEVRLVAGYYLGPDLRSKYAQFEALRDEFGYVSLMFNL